MKNTFIRLLTFLMLFSVIFTVPSYCDEPAVSAASETTSSSDKVASADEKAPAQTVGEEGMIAVTAEGIKEGVYSITVDSSSSMFKIEKAELTVKDGKMTVTMTMSGTGYTKIFMGTGEEAAAADESAYIPFAEDSEGAHTYTFEIEALNKIIDCASFSKRKEKWYDRQLVFRSDNIPEEAFLIDMNANKLDYEDGEYTAEVKLEGGSGKATVTSPAKITIKDGEATARIEWSSPNYDYMIISGKKYFPIKGEENSVFEIPVYQFDKPVTVIADTVAMSKPHEIEYTLTFDSSSIEKPQSIVANAVAIGALAVLVIAAVTARIIIKRKKKKK